jgi:cytochrome oxidase Cu insertion factor (SCO1/SenC/PrrC family)
MSAIVRAVFAILLSTAICAAQAQSGARPTPIGIGDVAPDFTLSDQHGRGHTLSAERGKRPVVLVFYRGHW